MSQNFFFLLIEIKTINVTPRPLAISHHRQHSCDFFIDQHFEQHNDERKSTGSCILLGSHYFLDLDTRMLYYLLSGLPGDRAP